MSASTDYEYDLAATSPCEAKPRCIELTHRYEIAAAFAVGDLAGASLRVKDVADHVADLGGYANKYSGGLTPSRCSARPAENSRDPMNAQT